ncbi:hypothetical protein SAMN05518672_10424 [Chitinophaga sp. CF118]|uniref:hypothetical protein n=1 Tax=Chitinophaga sp. CF118 TaxID=1884367 RepID=UPI0008E6A304|nr:hypothetical protein [Chitinophaga sp. CF118]SFD98157.1 hypothetical protein SAMN05518672_10424 [Chitinophaga sp. CF118]
MPKIPKGEIRNVTPPSKKVRIQNKSKQDGQCDLYLEDGSSVSKIVPLGIHEYHENDKVESIKNTGNVELDLLT